MRICDTCITEDCDNCVFVLSLDAEDDLPVFEDVSTINGICDFKLLEGAVMPTYATPQSSGMDIRSTANTIILPGE